MTSEEVAGLSKIRRKRLWIWFWMISFLPALWIAKSAIPLRGAGLSINIIWAIGYFGSMAREVLSSCPRCGGLFFSTDKSPSIRNVFANKCMQCGLPLKAERVIYPSLE